MKIKVYLSVAFLCCTLFALGNSNRSAKDTVNVEEVEYRFALGVQLGTDIGGAIPFPFSNIPHPFNPRPQLSPSLGVKLTFPLVRHWTIGAELTYKKVAIDADARIKNQRFNDEDRGVVARFTGSAEMGMDFTMLEIPLYAKYTFRNEKDRILFGGYFAWMINSKFDIQVNKGYMMDDNGVYSGPIVDEPLKINFNDILDSWDAGLIVGYERRLLPRMEIGLRVSCGLKDIFKRDNQYFDYKMLHMRGTLVLSYNLFNSKPSGLNPFKHKIKDFN